MGLGSGLDGLDRGVRYLEGQDVPGEVDRNRNEVVWPARPSLPSAPPSACC